MVELTYSVDEPDNPLLSCLKGTYTERGNCDRLPVKGKRLMCVNQFWKSNVIEDRFEYSLIYGNCFRLVIFHNTWLNHTKVIRKLHCIDYNIDVCTARGLHGHFLVAKVVCNVFSPKNMKAVTQKLQILIRAQTLTIKLATRVLQQVFYIQELFDECNSSPIARRI